jgi:methyl-galactoside transport system substrate-binding protein
MSKIKSSLEDIQKNNTNEVNFTFFDCKNNQAIQNEIINSLPSTDFDLLVVNLIDTKEFVINDVISRARQKNIPIIIFNIEPSSVSPDITKSYEKAIILSTDSKQLGTLQGNILINKWNTNKNSIDKNNDGILQYIIFQGTPYSPIALERTKYSISAINDAGIKTQQLELKDAYWDKELAKLAMESLLLKYNGNIEAIISNNDAMAIGAIETLQKFGYNKNDKSKYVSVVGIDALEEAKDLVDKGFMTGTVTQDPTTTAEALYKIGLNLINNLNPLENTNYEFDDKGLVKTMSYHEYVK